MQYAKAVQVPFKSIWQAGDVSRDSPIAKLRTNAHTGNSVCHSSIDMTPNTNMTTVIHQSEFAPLPRAIARIPTKDDEVPPLRHLRIPRHETSMDIWLFVHGPSGLHPDLLTKVKEGVRNDRRDGRE